MDIEVYEIALMPIIVGLVEVIKQFNIPSKYVPIVALVLGIIFGIVFVSDGDILQGVLVGISMGLGAVGLYSGVTNFVEKKDQDS